MFRKFHATYLIADKVKSDLYVDALPLLNSGRLDLLDIPRANNQLISLERRTSRGGRDRIDHPVNGHDDLANVICGCANLLINKPSGDYLYRGWLDDDADDKEAAAAFQHARLRQRIFALSGGRVLP
jgi:hypothetical protein